jgi:hypothetical protein
MDLLPLIISPVATVLASKQVMTQEQAYMAQIKTISRILGNKSFTASRKEAPLSKKITNYTEFSANIPLQTYEDLVPYIQRIQNGERNVLWPGKPLYFAKTSGTTSGSKYIPVTKASMANHLQGARNTLLHYIHHTKDISFLQNGRKMLFLSGSPQLEDENRIPTGRLSGIVNHHIPFYLRSHYLPTYATNCIADWEQKIDRIVEETISTDLSVIAGIPPWIQMYFDKLQHRTGKPIGEIFPNLSILIHGGMRFEPYKERLLRSIGRNITTLETYATSEGFIAYQNIPQEEGMLLQMDSGIFFEFIPMETLSHDNPTRLHIRKVEVGVDYAIVVSTNAGLLSYVLGDTVRFTSLNPPKIIVTGRVQQFTSAFGEHVIIEEIEKAMTQALMQHPNVEVREYMVAPQVGTNDREPSNHEWLIAFENPPADMQAFASEIDTCMCQQNSYYNELVKGNVLSPLRITPLQPDAFISYMRATGKLGEQNKIVRAANDRTIADQLLAYKA